MLPAMSLLAVSMLVFSLQPVRSAISSSLQIQRKTSFEKVFQENVLLPNRRTQVALSDDGGQGTALSDDGGQRNCYSNDESECNRMGPFDFYFAMYLEDKPLPPGLENNIDPQSSPEFQSWVDDFNAFLGIRVTTATCSEMCEDETFLGQCADSYEGLERTYRYGIPASSSFSVEDLWPLPSDEEMDFAVLGRQRIYGISSVQTSCYTPTRGGNGTVCTVGSSDYSSDEGLLVEDLASAFDAGVGDEKFEALVDDVPCQKVDFSSDCVVVDCSNIASAPAIVDCCAGASLFTGIYGLLYFHFCDEDQAGRGQCEIDDSETNGVQTGTIITTAAPVEIANSETTGAPKETSITTTAPPVASAITTETSTTAAPSMVPASPPLNVKDPTSVASVHSLSARLLLVTLGVGAFYW